MTTHSMNSASTWEKQCCEKSHQTQYQKPLRLNQVPSTQQAAFILLQCHKEACLAAQRVSRKDKSDDHELWPHAISRHQSGDSTILRTRKAWPEVTATSCRSCRCSFCRYTVDRIERTLQSKNTNAWEKEKPKWARPQEMHCSHCVSRRSTGGG